jgi:uncharacterized protein YfiM (DUF2279 family)
MLSATGNRVAARRDILADATKSRDFTWTDTTKNQAIADAWNDLFAGSNYHWKALGPAR